jgi:septum formation protein
MQKHSAGKNLIMFENLAGYRIVLASNSPRRKELLSGLGLPFVVQTTADADESYPVTLKGAGVARFIAFQKAEAFRKKMTPADLVITADTIVCYGDEVFGKPVDAADAVRMLNILSGKRHQVYTGVCLTSEKHQVAFTAETEVQFSELTDKEINYYVEHHAPFDKAGAYGIQEWIGFVGVEQISGSYFNVMGLPMHRLYAALKEFPPLRALF